MPDYLGTYTTLANVAQGVVFLVENPPGSRKGVEWRKLTPDNPPANALSGCWCEAVNGGAKMWLLNSQPVYLYPKMSLVDDES